MAGHITLSEVKNGTAGLLDLLKINAVMDAQEAAEAAALAKQK